MLIYTLLPISMWTTNQINARTTSSMRFLRSTRHYTLSVKYITIVSFPSTPPHTEIVRSFRTRFESNAIESFYDTLRWMVINAIWLVAACQCYKTCVVLIRYHVSFKCYLMYLLMLWNTKSTAVYLNQNSSISFLKYF